MKIGCCVPRERIAGARAAGFDFAELAVVDNLCPTQDEAAWRPIRAEILAGGLPVEACNVFFSGDWQLIGPAADREAVRRYVETAARHAAEIGVQVMVLGSDKARSIPAGMPEPEARLQLAQLLEAMGEIAARHGVVIALEPLRAAETNLVHTLPEALAIVRPLANPHVRVLADFYHFDEGQEPLSDLLLARDLLAHVHLADTGRLAPGTGRYDYGTFFAHLRQIAYAGRVSVECRWQDWERESRAAVAFLRGC